MGVPTRSEGFNRFILLFQLCASQTVHRNIVNGKTLISSIIQYPLIDLCSFYFAKCKGIFHLISIIYIINSYIYMYLWNACVEFIRNILHNLEMTLTAFDFPRGPGAYAPRFCGGLLDFSD